MAKRKAANRRPAPVEIDDDEESSSSWSSSSEISTSSLSSFSDLSSESRRPLLNIPIIRQRKMKTVKPKPLRSLLGNDLAKPRKRKITLE